jgi:hypothetical protein
MSDQRDDAEPLEGPSLSESDAAFLDGILREPSLASPELPADIAARWDDAIGAESAARIAGATPEGTPVDVESAAFAAEPLEAVTGTVVPMLGRRGHGKPKRRGFALAGVAASVAAVALVGGVIANQVASTSTPGAVTAEDAGAAVGARSTSAPLPTASAVTYSGATYTASQVSNTVSTLISTPQAAYVPSPEDSEGAVADARPPATESSPSTAETGATEDGSRPLSSDSDEVDPTSGESADNTLAAINTLATDPQAREACIAYLAQESGVSPAAIDVGTFEGGPALMVVLPTLDTPGKVDVFIIGATCTSTNADVKYFTRIDIPQR